MAAFKVGDASEYLAITGWGIDAVKLAEKTWVWVWLLPAALLEPYLFVLLRRRAKQGRRLSAGPPPNASSPETPTKRPSLSWPQPTATPRTGGESPNVSDSVAKSSTL
jgi:hypothetical protein